MRFSLFWLIPLGLWIGDIIKNYSSDKLTICLCLFWIFLQSIWMENKNRKFAQSLDGERK